MYTIGEKVFYGLMGLLVVILSFLVGLAIFSQWTWSEENVSGIVYNTSNNGFVDGKTKFMVRASVDSYIDPEANQSSYCVPQSSPYKELINKAAANKNIRVQVQTRKGFWIKAPWTCIDNVVVTEVK